MSKIQKLIDRFLECPKDLTYQEMVKILMHFGYKEEQKAGSRVRFLQEETKHIIRVHKPHPENYFKTVYIKEIIKNLKEKGVLK